MSDSFPFVTFLFYRISFSFAKILDRCASTWASESHVLVYLGEVLHDPGSSGQVLREAKGGEEQRVQKDRRICNEDA